MIEMILIAIVAFLVGGVFGFITVAIICAKSRYNRRDR